MVFFSYEMSKNRRKISNESNKSEVLRIFAGCGSGVRALALTPPGVFGDLLHFTRLQTEVRDRTVARAGPHSR